MAVYFHNQEIDFILPEKNKISNWIEEVIFLENFFIGDINLIFTGKEYLLKINQKYLSHDYHTDVITFDYNIEKIISGDIFISVETVFENAKIYKKNKKEEMLRIIIHGILHLLNYKDKDKKDKIIMKEKEDLYIKFFEKNLSF
ncbi:MAG: rRNA maturation RNase YbeY [Bacteroidetes bacterium 4572_128]|nr:MAG: rRNA maturation RNase YbeY [Bacteroidetes bacterium 4572_128]